VVAGVKTLQEYRNFAAIAAISDARKTQEPRSHADFPVLSALLLSRAPFHFHGETKGFKLTTGGFLLTLNKIAFRMRRIPGAVVAESFSRFIFCLPPVFLRLQKAPGATHDVPGIRSAMNVSGAPAFME